MYCSVWERNRLFLHSHVQALAFFKYKLDNITASYRCTASVYQVQHSTVLWHSQMRLYYGATTSAIVRCVHLMNFSCMGKHQMYSKTLICTIFELLHYFHGATLYQVGIAKLSQLLIREEVYRWIYLSLHSKNHKAAV